MTTEGFGFEVQAATAPPGPRDSRLPRVVETPCFMPSAPSDGEAVSPRELDELGAQVVLANTYHSTSGRHRDRRRARRPARLHALDGPILTDSGGFQCSASRARA